MMLLQLGLLLVALASPSASTNTYLVLVPQTIKPGTSLKIPVHFLPAMGRMNSVTAKLVDRDNFTLSSVTETNFPGPYRSRGRQASSLDSYDFTLELPIPGNVSWGSYRVNVTGEGETPFENSTYVYGSSRSQVILIQTDKAMYKPGETVMYRVFAINGSMQLTPSIIDIEIFDPKGNKLYESMNQDNKKAGGIEGELPLSDMPPLGNWRIKAQVQGEDSANEDYNFEVREYVLPKFEVTVNLPSFGRDTDVSLVGTAKAMYTFGKPVKGTLILTVKKRYGDGFNDPSAIRTQMEIDGEASFEIPMTVLERLTRNLEYETLLVIANVTEAITGITLRGEGEIRYHSNPYRLEFYPNLPANFKPGFGNYSVWLKVTEQDGRPSADPLGPVSITVTYFTDKPIDKTTLGNDTITLPGYDVISPFIEGDTIMKRTETYPIAADGNVQFEIPIPDKTATFTIKAEFGENTAYKDVRRFRSPKDIYIEAALSTNNPLKIGDTATVTLSTNASPSTIYYVLLCRGEVARQGSVSGTQASVTFTVGRELTPAAKFVAYFVQPDGEIVADGFNFVVDDIFENKVTIAFNETNVTPKTGVNLVVRADEGSLVNVLAVDKSVLLLADGNDITPRRVEDALSNLGDTPRPFREWGRPRPWSFSADDVSDIFNSAQLRVLTDANLYSFNLWSLSRGYGGGAGGPMSARMMASPMMADGNMVEMGGGAEGELRQDFPETWIWRSAVAGPGGEAVFSDIAPDTITEFQANAFAIHPDSGLGVAPSRSNLTVFKPFFVNLQLPYSIVRGEVAIIQVNVFNYRQTDHYVKVHLKESPDYDIISVSSTGTETPITGDAEKYVQVRKGVPTPVYFTIRATRVGTTSVYVGGTITDPAIFDHVIVPLPIKPEGVAKEKNQPVFVSLNSSSTQEVRDITYPTTGLVPDSGKLRVYVIGDLFGQSLKHLGDLIQMPYGCGEQNMVNLAPSVFASLYMSSTGRLDNDLELQDKIERIINTGLQRQMVFQRNDGSFSAFGNADDEGSLWLTAFVTKTFAQASSLTCNCFVDPKVIDKAVKYMTENQNVDGSFINTGVVSQKSVQGDTASSNRTLTAYALIALELVRQKEVAVTPETSLLIADSVRSARSYLSNSIRDMTSSYEMAIALYAFQLGGPRCLECDILLKKLESPELMIQEGTSKYWNHSSRALEIEQTAYMLSAFALRDDKYNGSLVLSWLTKQRNTRGGFYSTQDTVVALQALTEFALLVYTRNVSLDVTITTSSAGVTSGTPATISLDSESHDVLQYRDFNGSVDRVTIDATGTGMALIDINQYYNVRSEEASPSYQLQVSTLAETSTSYTVRVCASFIPGARSNMAIMDIGVISGFEPQKDQVAMTGTMKKMELTANRLIIYWDEIPSSEVCVEVPVQRVSLVAGVKPASVLVYSYYEPLERAMVEYLPSALQSTNVCTTCPLCCEDTVPDAMTNSETG